MKLIYTLDDLTLITEQLLQRLPHKTWLFYGEMGSGKTTLIKALIAQLGSIDTASSPTFGLVNQYQSSSGNINHFDFYRLKNPEEALDIGVEEYFDSDAWNFVEWPEKITGFLPEKYSRITLKKIDKTTREITLE